MKINKFTSFHLRLIAMLTMVIDHVGYFMFPKITILRIIGRISFPIFAFLCAEAMHYSSNKLRYILVLAGFDIIIASVIYLFTGTNFGSIFSCLAISALTIYLLQSKKMYFKLFAIIPLLYALFASFKFTPFVVQYGIYGVLLILGFYGIRVLLNYISISFGGDDQTFNFSFYYALSCSLYLLSISLISYNWHTFFNAYIAGDGMNFSIQSNAFLACPFILLYSGSKGYSSKWFKKFCYLFYPAHVLVILLIMMIF